MSERKPRIGQSRTTLSDVADYIGVSAITVSRALNKPELVSEALRVRIDEAVQTLGYVPNRAARALASARSHSVVVLVPSLSNTVFVDTLAAIHDTLYPSGYQMLIGDTRYSAQEEENLLRTYLEYNPDGILITGFDHTPATRSLLGAAGIPTVHMMELDDSATMPCVGFSQFDSGYALTRFLIEKGYRRIAFLAAQLDPRTLKRGEGYRAALREAGLYSPQRELAEPSPSSVGLGAQLLDRLLEQAPDCDAIFCNNDDLALGVMFQCQRRHIAVPEQLAIAGFNDLDASAWTNPPLTSVATPRYEIGREAALMLLALMSGRAPVSTRVDLGYRLVVRHST
ncbi:LacI family DNA-binding transcriptional regulator [Pseudogulbenkiania sp. MAI-1]|uniref:LacI family DNA-binding transcriptional regulator n=1 Tax=Pseudogulbenkiania sp. MAI-1 TaxID=990370 RepID=UPI00045EAB1C|nr:LacI family DNA-binding transcriptional regulator [Pseudogulbenkiania sp. MAI-1]